MPEPSAKSLHLSMLRVVSTLQFLAALAFVMVSYRHFWSVATTVLGIVTFFGIAISYYRKDVAAAILFATSAAWLMQMSDVFAYFVYTQRVVFKVVVYATAMAALSLANLFLADYIWLKSNGKPFKPVRLAIIVAVLAAIPFASHVYRTRDIDRAEYRINYHSEGTDKPRIVFQTGGMETAPVVITHKDAFLAITANSQTDSAYWYSTDCRLRVTYCFTRITKISLIDNNTFSNYYDDRAEISTSGQKVGLEPFEMQLSDLWW